MCSTDRQLAPRMLINQVLCGKKGLPGGSVVKNLPANAGDAASIPT